MTSNSEKSAEPRHLFDQDPLDRRLAKDGLPIFEARETTELRCRRLLEPLLDQPPLSTEQALQRIRADADWRPFLIAADKDRIVWVAFDSDLSDYPFYYDAALLLLPGLPEKALCTTDCAMLADIDILPDEAPPDGLLFHFSRSGSTLLSKALARDPAVSVSLEGPPGSLGLWQWLTDNWRALPQAEPRVLRILRNMLVLTGRRRVPGERSLVKMMSFNLLFFRLFHQAVPQVPALFMYRNPLEVYISTLKRPPESWPRWGTAGGELIAGSVEPMGQAGFYRAVLSRLLDEAQAHASLKLLNYEHCRPEHLMSILHHGFDWQVTDKQVGVMSGAFDSYSKATDTAIGFKSDVQQKLASAPAWLPAWLDEALAEPFQALEASPRNLVRLWRTDRCSGGL